jgi:hypothetical protein
MEDICVVKPTGGGGRMPLQTAADDARIKVRVRCGGSGEVQTERATIARESSTTLVVMSRFGDVTIAITRTETRLAPDRVRTGAVVQLWKESQNIANVEYTSQTHTIDCGHALQVSCAHAGARGPRTGQGRFTGGRRDWD